MKKCPFCGTTDNHDDNEVCYNCGKKQDSARLKSNYENNTDGLDVRSNTTTSSGTIGLCPFSWIKVSKPAGCFSAIFGGKDELVTEPQPCMKSNCQLWDSFTGNCGLITKK